MPASDQGVDPFRYRLIPRTLIFLTRGDQVLLIKGAPDKRLWANRYNGLGGHIERGEDVLTAARRELVEETGLTCPDLHLCGTVIVDPGENTGIGIFVLRGELAEGDLNASQEGMLEWVPYDKILALPLVEDLPVLLSRVLQMQPGSPPFTARSTYDESGRLMVTFSA